MKHLDLFSGIGGFSLACDWNGIETIGFVEIDKYCQKVLRKHWPNVPIVEDIRDVKEDTFQEPVDLLTGGFPCQDIADIGKRAGIYGSRSSMWFEMARLIGEIRPQYAVVENVPALLKRGMGHVLGSLSEIGYDAEWKCIQGREVGSPQKRERLFIVAYPSGNHSSGILDSKHNYTQHEIWNATKGNKTWEEWKRWFISSLSDSDWQENSNTDNRVVNGVPERVHRIRCLGNTVVPQVAYEIIKVIKEIDGR